MKFKDIRKNLNDIVKEKGNSLTPCMAEIGIGLGDGLTTEVNFKRVLMTLGAMTPYVIAYQLCKETGSGNAYLDFFNTAGNTFVLSLCYTVIGLPIFSGAAGYEIGKKIDEKLKRK